MINQYLSKLTQNEFVMNNLDSEDQTKEIAECYLQLLTHHTSNDAYDLMRLLEDKHGWTGSLENCLFLDDVLRVLES